MPTCVLVKPDGSVSELTLPSKYFPTPEMIAGEEPPVPFVLNIFFRPNLEKFISLFGTTYLQWSRTPDKGIRVLFPAPETWTLPGLEKLGWKNVNRKATFVCKHHEIFGSAIFFRIQPESGDLSREDFEKIYENSKPKLHESETNDGEIKKFVTDQNFATPLTTEERRKIRETYAWDMCDRRNLMSLELIYLLLNPMIEKQYVVDGKAFYNSIPSYAISDDFVQAYVMISFESGVSEATGADYIYMRPDQYPMVRPPGYEDLVGRMKTIMDQAGLKYKAPILTQAEEDEYNRKMLECRKDREEFMKGLKEKKKKVKGI